MNNQEEENKELLDLLANKKYNRMVAWNNRKVVDVPIDEGIKTYRDVKRDDVNRGVKKRTKKKCIFLFRV